MSDLNLDEPFVSTSITAHPPAVVTPVGTELVLGSECEDNTIVIEALELKVLRRMCNPAFVHTRPTVREMSAVVPET